MKRILVFASLAFFTACNSNEPAKTDTMKSGMDSTMQAINSPFAIGYSSKFVMDDPKNAESLLTLWKDWENGDLSAHKDLFADSVTMTFADGYMMHASRDSVLAAAQKMRNNLASSVDFVDAIMAVKSTDKNENWAIIWGKEVNADKKGKVDSTNLQETWRFNKDGKTDLMFQYKQAILPPKK
jgi:hypothetical protein